MISIPIISPIDNSTSSTIRTMDENLDRICYTNPHIYRRSSGQANVAVAKDDCSGEFKDDLVTFIIHSPRLNDSVV